MTALLKAQVITASRGFAAMLFSIAASPVLHQAGVSFQTISIGYGILYLILAAVQIPTGVWADIFGTKRAALIGGCLQAIALVLLGVGGTEAWQVLTGFALYGLGSSFVTRAISALTFETARLEEKDSFNSGKFFSNTEKAAVASYVLASMSVGFLSEYMGRQSLLVAGFFFLATSIFVASKFSELPISRSHTSLQKEFTSRMSESFAVIRKSIELKALLPVRILHQVETVLGVMWLPWIQQLGGGDAKWFSVLSTGSYLLRYAVNHAFAKKTRPETYLWRMMFSLLLMALGCGICIFAQNVWAALFGVWIMAGARGAFLPAVQAIQHEGFNDSVRTTGLSSMNFSVDAMIAISYFASASIVERMSIPSAWGISAVSFLLAAAFCLWALNSLKKDKGL